MTKFIISIHCKIFIIEFVKEIRNSCVMWIDFSEDKKAVNKLPVNKSEIDVEDEVHSPRNTDTQNTTYVIHKSSSVRCSPEIINDNDKTVIISSPSLDIYNETENSIHELEQDICNGNSEIDVKNENNLTENFTSTTRRRRSSSIFIDTLRKLVCLHER